MEVTWEVRAYLGGDVGGSSVDMRNSHVKAETLCDDNVQYEREFIAFVTHYVMTLVAINA